jgi:hypothetical protein
MPVVVLVVVLVRAARRRLKVTRSGTSEFSDTAAASDS